MGNKNTGGSKGDTVTGIIIVTEPPGGITPIGTPYTPGLISLQPGGSSVRVKPLGSVMVTTALVIVVVPLLVIVTGIESVVPGVYEIGGVAVILARGDNTCTTAVLLLFAKVLSRNSLLIVAVLFNRTGVVMITRATTV